MEENWLLLGYTCGDPRCLNKVEGMEQQKKDEFVARCEQAECKKWDKAKRLAIETRARVATGEYTASWQGESASVKVVGAPPAPTEAPPATNPFDPAPGPSSQLTKSQKRRFRFRNKKREDKEREKQSLGVQTSAETDKVPQGNVTLSVRCPPRAVTQPEPRKGPVGGHRSAGPSWMNAPLGLPEGFPNHGPPFTPMIRPQLPPKTPAEVDRKLQALSKLMPRTSSGRKPDSKYNEKGSWQLKASPYDPNPYVEVDPRNTSAVTPTMGRPDIPSPPAPKDPLEGVCTDITDYEKRERKFGRGRHPRRLPPTTGRHQPPKDDGNPPDPRPRRVRWREARLL